MKKLFILHLMLIVLISSCTFNVSVLTPETADSAQLTPYATTPAPTITSIATISATAAPSPTWVPPSTDPVFFDARTSSTSDDLHQQSSFPAGTKVVYAIWDYQNMRAGLKIRREWYWNNQLWLTREETWDFEKYGVDGTLRDISIYDNETGLNAGAYRLQVYIDNVPQPIGKSASGVYENAIYFEILPYGARTDKASPDFNWVASVLDGNQLTVRDTSGTSSVLSTTRGEIPYFVWFPDSQHILVVNRYYVDPALGAEAGIQDILQIADVSNKSVEIIYESDGPLGALGEPVISPDGRYIATTQGSGNGDACFKPLKSIFFAMTDDFKRQDIIEQEQFAGIPDIPDSSVYPDGPGNWQSNTSYIVPLKITCTTDESLMGSYQFDMRQLTASRFPAGTQLPGDLGRGMIHGIVTDAITGALISHASVTCQQHSYTTAAPCSGTVLTDANGAYAFYNVSFHDTDSITLRIEAPGYKWQELGGTAFTINDWEADVGLYPE